MTKSTVLLADDHAVVRKGLRYLLDQSGIAEVIAEASDGREAVQLAQTLRPNLVIIDIQMPLLNGIDAAAQIMKDRPETTVIILSMYSDESYIGVSVYTVEGHRGNLMQKLHLHNTAEIVLYAVRKNLVPV